MADYRLYGFAQSGNSYRVALFLDAVGADWEPVFVDFFNGGARTPEFLALNPMGEAPVLEGPDGTMTQSGAILDALSRRFDQYGGRTERERYEILRWILWDNHKLNANAAIYRFMTNFMPEAKRDDAVNAFLRGRFMSALKVFERRVAAQDYVAVADRPTIADISCAAYLFFDDELGLDMADWPATAAWRDRVAALPNWRPPYKALPGHPDYDAR